MSIAVEIKIQDGKITITVGGAGKTKSDDLGAVVGQHNLSEAEPAGKKGGAPPGNQPIDPGGGGIGASGVTVIGPIVICSASATAGSDDGGAPPGNQPIDPGGGPAGTSGTSGVLVIGPIVIGGATAEPPAPGPVVHVVPPKE